MRAPVPPFEVQHEALRAEIRAFVEGELRPRAGEWEAARWFPNELFRQVAARGYLDLRGLDAAVWAEELSRCGSGGVAAGLGAHTGIALPPIERFGTEDQRRRYAEPGRRGELIAALAITEPDAGSDVAALRTAAERVEGGYLVNGSKMFITGGCRADVLVTAVRTGAQGGHHGISFLIVERGPGVESRAIEKMGWHASDTAHITFDDVFVPEENLLGEENEGFRLIMANFQWERLLMALGAVGAMQVALERALALEGARRERVAEMALALERGRALTYGALGRYLAGTATVQEVTAAKLATQRAAFQVLDDCLQLHELAGYFDEELGRAVRDARLGPIGGGTDEIMKEILGRTLGL